MNDLSFEELKDKVKSLEKFEDDGRIYPRIWAEYYVAFELKKRKPDWQVIVEKSYFGRHDVTCIANGNKKKLTTWMWIQYENARWELSMVDESGLKKHYKDWTWLGA